MQSKGERIYGRNELTQSHDGQGLLYYIKNADGWVFFFSLSVPFLSEDGNSIKDLFLWQTGKVTIRSLG